MPGRSVSHYEILEELGRGGTGVVYRARDQRLGRIVALKFLSPEWLASEEAVARFLQEARTISALNHPHIATLYDVGEEAGSRFLVLEYLPGGTLRARLRDLRMAGGRLSFEDICHWAVQVCEGLAHAHRHGIVHRDVKSGNVMFSEEGAAKLTDFGLAKSPGGGDLTRTGTIAGTVACMSPEQAQGLEADHRSDIFSTGVMLYEMASGELPFQGPHVAAILREVIIAPTPAVAQVRPDLPEAFGELVSKATAKDPGERYQSAEELAGDLRALASGGAREPRTASGAAADSALTAVTRPPTAWPERPRRPGLRRLSRRTGIAAATLLAAVSLALSFRLPLTDWLGPGRLPEQKQLAVLPFINVGRDQASQAFCDGLMETLSTKLTQLEQFQGALRVVPSAEVRREKVASPREAQRAFGATLALTGSVERSGDRLRLNLNLVDTKSLRQLRADTIDTRIGDVAVLQDGVVSQVAGMLRLELNPDAQKVLGAGGTQVAAAYDLYVQGVGHLARWDKAQNIESAISLFQKAIQQDPRYALAHAGLGEAFWRKYQLAMEPQWVEEARKSCTRAVELNSRLADLYVTRGNIHTGTGSYQVAVQDFERALKLNPVSAAAYRGLAQAYDRLGRSQDAELTFRKAIELRPNDWAGYQDLGRLYIRRAEYAKAEECLRRVTELTPDNYWGFSVLGAVYHYQGRFEQAIAMIDRSIQLRPTGGAYSNLGTIYSFQGRYQEAARAFEKALELGTANRAIWGNLAEAYLRVPGQAEKAPEAYRRAIQLTERDLAVNPKDAEVRAHLAVYCARLNQRQRALVEAAKARGLAAGNKTVLFRCALAYELAGRRSLALETLKGALRGGYSRAEVERHPDLADLRQDPRYTALMRSSSAATPGQTAR